MEIIDLDDVMLSPEMVAAWHVMASRFAAAMAPLGISPDEIPDEQVKIESDGSLSIFVTLPQGNGEVSMRVPADHWARRQ